MDFKTIISNKINQIEITLKKFDLSNHSYNDEKLREIKNNLKGLKIIEENSREDIEKLCEFIKNKSNYIVNFNNFVENTIIMNTLNTRELESSLVVLENEIKEIEFFFDEIKSLILLEKFSKNDKDIILIGTNGSGKSFLANYLKEKHFNNIVVFSAQKYLFFLKDDRYNYIEIDKAKMLNDRFNNKAKFENNSIHNVFTKAITALSNEYVGELDEIRKTKEERETIYDKVRDIFNKILVDIDIIIDVKSRQLVPKKNKEEYDFNQMSDGERAILFYIIQVVMSNKNSYIIVDEPETHLNSALVIKLWDLLKKEREDCKFIFISHNIDFISTRKNVDILWCKKFEYPGKWDLVELKEKILPIELLSKLVGSKKPILFCEGTEESYDYEVYSAIFQETHNIFPVENHRNVISYVTTYKATKKICQYESFGIVDGDLIEKSEKISYREKNIIVLPFNEIEMFLLDEYIVTNLLSLIYDKIEVNKKIDVFKNELINNIKNNKEEIILEKIKKFIDTKLEKEKINNNKTREMLKESFKKLTTISIDEKYEEYEEELDKIISSKNYEEALKWCSLKEKISKGLANKCLEFNYLEKAIVRIKNDDELKKKLREKYFKI
ncbi:MAG: DUF4435 domain-containing protein [Cetobacterium sp.]